MHACVRTTRLVSGKLPRANTKLRELCCSTEKAVPCGSGLSVCLAARAKLRHADLVRASASAEAAVTVAQFGLESARRSVAEATKVRAALR
jgi:hypothetical protein